MSLRVVLYCRGRRVTCRAREFSRAEYCDIRINLLSVSREHAEIVVDDENKVCDSDRRMRPSTALPDCRSC